MTEPSTSDLREKLQSMGYRVGTLALVWGYAGVWVPLLVLVLLFIIGAVM